MSRRKLVKADPSELDFYTDETWFDKLAFFVGIAGMVIVIVFMIVIIVLAWT